MHPKPIHRSLISLGFSAPAVIWAGVAAALAVAVPSQAPAGMLLADLSRHLLPVDGADTAAVVYGDWDADGDLDLFCGNTGGMSAVFINTGGFFSDETAQRWPTVVEWTQCVAAADVDGDGDLDIVCGNAFEGYAWWYAPNSLFLNDGSGVFTAAPSGQLPQVSDITRAIAMGDVDGDGDFDLICGNGYAWHGEQNRLLLNNGSGTFVDVTSSHLPVQADATRSLTLGDVDGDGDLDLVVGNEGEQNRLYINNGGVFSDATAQQLPVDADLTLATTLGDVDGDGDLDLVIGNSWQQDRLYLNSGTGTFSDATASQMPVDSVTASSVALSDVDGDGDVDLVIGSYGQNRLYSNNGTGMFSDATASQMPVSSADTRSLAICDVDGDGDFDLAWGNSGQNRLLLNTGAGTFVGAVTNPVGAGSTLSSAFADVDGDGDADLLLGNGGQDLLLLNDGYGEFVSSLPGQMPANGDWTSSIAVGDVDGDGDVDLVCGRASYPNAEDQLFLNNGFGTFVAAPIGQLPASNTMTEALALGDVDGDGDLDLVSVTDGTGTCLYLNDGSGSFTDATSTQVPFHADANEAVALADVDADGDLDMMIAGGYYGAQTRLYLNDGSGVFSDATVQMPSDHSYSKALSFGDVDGDGDLDLLLGNNGPNDLYINNGSGVFANETAQRLPNDNLDSAAVVLVDVDRDGDLDIVCGNSGGSHNGLFLNDGAGVFSDASAGSLASTAAETHTLAMADIDGDGDSDVVFGNIGENQLIHNLGGQLHAPHLLLRGRPYRMDAYIRHAPVSAIELAAIFVATAAGPGVATPFGELGIDPTLAVGLPAVVLPQATEVGSVTFNVPNLASLIGQEIFSQAMLVGYPSQLRLSNVVRDVVR